MVSEFEDLKDLFDISSVTVDEFIQKLIVTQMTSEITNIPMRSDEHFLTFGYNTSQLSVDQIKM